MTLRIKKVSFYFLRYFESTQVRNACYKKELDRFNSSKDGVFIVHEAGPTEWHITFQCPERTVYSGEVHTLIVK